MSQLPDQLKQILNFQVFWSVLRNLDIVFMNEYYDSYNKYDTIRFDETKPGHTKLSYAHIILSLHLRNFISPKDLHNTMGHT